MVPLPSPARAVPSPARPGAPGRWPRRLGLALLPLLVVGVAACASSGERTGSGGNPNLLTPEEMAQSNSTDLLSIIEERRPRWVRGGRVVSPYSMNSGETVVVYFDQNRQGGPDVLRGVPVHGVREVRFLSGPDAQQRFGLDHRMGAIVVSFIPRGG